jgi:hypothetical protein
MTNTLRLYGSRSGCDRPFRLVKHESLLIDAKMGSGARFFFMASASSPGGHTQARVSHRIIPKNVVELSVKSFARKAGPKSQMGK